MSDSIQDINDDEHIETPVDVTVDEPVEVTVDEPAEVTVDEPVEVTVDEPAEVTVDEPAEVTVDEPAEVTVDEPVDVTVDEPVDVTVDEPVDVTVDEPVEVTVDEPAEVTVDEPVDVTMDEPVEVTVDEPAEETVDEPAEETVDEPAEETVDEPAEETVDEPAEETVDEPADNITFSIDTNVITPKIPNIIFIIPYRDREKQYEFFSKHMKSVLEDFPTDSFKILYIHQNDTRSFNRGAVKNIGFMTVKNMYPNDYQNMTLVFNDIDIMPYTKNFFDYHTRPGTVKHFYGFTFTLGGIVSINAKDFEIINGFPNFWSWGYEDNMLQRRIIERGITIDRSAFYPILDKNVLHFSEGITRNVNRTEYDIYESNTTEGLDSIFNLQYNYNPDNGFVDVTNFSTTREEDVKATHQHDLRKGNIPFPSLNKKRKPKMTMMFM